MFPVALLLALLLASAAQAQTYRCTAANGATYFADRPCDAPRPPDKLRALSGARGNYGTYYGQPVGGTYYTQRTGSMAQVQDHVKYLSPECASISEAIRTGPARGVRSNVISSLQAEYQQKCALDDRDARKQVYDDQSKQAQARDAAKQQRQQAAAHVQQCENMRDAVALKRKRQSQFDERELASLRDMERSYAERCAQR